MTATPFAIEIPEAKLDWIRERIRAHPWHDPPDAGWKLGPDDAWLRDFCAWWADGCDWRAIEAGLNKFDHFTAPADGLDIHFVHQPNPRDDARPLVLIHGWPGSFVEFLDLIGPLSDPAAHGAPAFHVVVPSLPGYAFSGKPASPIGPRAMARHLAHVMSETLGYDGYIAQGGDWGSVVAAWIGLEHAPACGAVHLNLFGARPSVAGPGGKGAAPAPLEGDEEHKWLADVQKFHAKEGGYFHVQSTKPETLAYAMLDSPVGVAAWIGDKFRTWIDGRERSLETVIGREKLLANIMTYVATDSFHTAAWTYLGARDEGSGLLPPGRRVEAPVGVANFPYEVIKFPTRRYVELGYNVVHWADMKSGGHFAALEEPEALAGDIRTFAALL